jgi:hypothetical protein
MTVDLRPSFPRAIAGANGAGFPDDGATDGRPAPFVDIADRDPIGIGVAVLLPTRPPS